MESKPFGYESTLGCPACFQGEAAAVWQALRFDSIARLVDDSHFSIDIMTCRDCGQRCVKIFTEFVDWQGGDDAQYWYLIPLTPEEASELTAQGEKVDTKRIEAISADRRVLQVDFPTGKASRIFWRIGHVLIWPGG